MVRSTWRRHIGAVILALVLTTAPWAANAAPTHAARSASAATVTLSVYTCCGSLSGFDDTNPADVSSMHAIYAALWAQRFPNVYWHETAFADQATLVSRLAAAVSAGTPPDMVFIQGDYMGDVVLRKLVQPLDAYYARYHFPNDYFLPGMTRWAHFGGHWWGIPAVSGPLGGQQIYLPKYMAPLGYNNSNLRTFDDYYAMSKKAVRFDKSGTLARIGYWPGIDSWETIGTLMCPPGHGLYGANDQPTATDPCNVTYLRYLKKLSDLYGGYAGLAKFLSGDPDFLGGNRNAYLATGKALIVPSSEAYWNITPLDSNTFGVKGGLSYQLTPLPPTPHGAMSEVVNYPSTMQMIVIPRGAKHAGTAFAISKMMCWDDGYLLGRATSGSPVTKNLPAWLHDVVAGEATARHLAGLPGNPAANLQGLKLQPQLGQVSRASNPINPVDVYYQQQLTDATRRVLLGLQSPQAALGAVQGRVLAQEQRLRARYGAWNW